MSFMVRAKALSEFDVSDIALKGDVNAFIFARSFVSDMLSFKTKFKKKKYEQLKSYPV